MKPLHYVAILVVALSLSAFTKPSKLKSKKKYDFFTYIPSGKLERPELKKSIAGFYMAITEITNREYRLFLKDMKDKADQETLDKIKVDAEAWNGMGGYNSPMAKLYFDHPSYDNYPVVNISHEAAALYCQWLEKKYKELDPNMEVNIRLPNSDEWTYAAQAGHDLTPYPWGGFYVKNAKQCYLANFHPENGFSEDGGYFTVPSTSYFPNDYGLYNMSGNVAEMTSKEGIAMGGSWYSKKPEDIQVNSQSVYQNASPTVGFRPVLTFKSTNKEKKILDPNKAWKKIFKQLNTN